jgi:hypothetical protein
MAQRDNDDDNETTNDADETDASRPLAHQFAIDNRTGTEIVYWRERDDADTSKQTRA